MIRQETINGRAATVAFLDDAFNPADEADATRIKVMFDDGSVLFGAVDPNAEEDNLLIDYMKKHGVPITRENYIDLAFGDGRTLTPGEEMSLPVALQKFGTMNERGIVRRKRRG